MRIGIDAHYVGVREGGNERYCESIIRCLGANGAPDHEYFVFSYQAAARRRLANDRLTHLPLRSSSVLWQRGVELPLYSRRLDLDVLHTPFNFLPVSRCKKIVTIHDLGFLHIPSTYGAAERMRMRVMTRLAARNADHVLTVSEFARQDIIERYRVAPSRITVTPNAVDRAVFRRFSKHETESFRQRLGLPSRYFLFVGVVQPRKNPATLIDAYARLPGRARTDHHLVLVGRLGRMHEEVLRLIAAHRLDGFVHRFDEVGATVLAGFYNAATALVVPSRWESFSIPILEAMSCGCPVICSRAAGMPEVYGDAALPFDPDDPEELVTHLQRIVDDPTLHSDLVRRGLVNCDRFSWERTARIVKGVYEGA